MRYVRDPLMFGVSNLRLNFILEFVAKIGFIRARYIILVSKNIYLSRGIQCCIYKNLNVRQSHKYAITQSHKHVPFLPKRAKIGSIKARDTILVPNGIFTWARKFSGASRKTIKSSNHALHAKCHSEKCHQTK